MTGGGPKPPGGPTEPTFELQSTDDQLVEIARAEAVLNKRDPEQAAVVARAQLLHRDAAMGRQQSAAQIYAAAQRGVETRRRRRIQVALAVVVLGAAAVPATKAWMKEKDRAAALATRLDGLGRPAQALGFRPAGQWLDAPAGGLSLDVPRDTCSALVAAREDASAAPALSIERQNGPTIAAKGPVLWCSCQPDKVTVRSPDGGARLALAWMTAPTRTAGGVDVLAARPEDGFQLVTDATGLGCNEGGFQGWAEKPGHGDLDPLDPARPGPAADLVAEGFEPAGLFPGSRTFAVIRAKKGRCYLAAPEPGRSEITLRGPEGTPLVTGASGAVAFCSHAADAVFSLWRPEKGPTAAVVLGAPAERSGGVMGLVLAARRHGYREVESALLPDDLVRDARAALAAAHVPAESFKDADAAGLPGNRENGIVAFSLRGKLSMLPEVAPEVPTVCLPAREGDREKPTPAFLCVQARGQVWRRTADAQQQGAVEAKGPYWLALWEGSSDEGALRSAATVLLFAQRMGLMGYEPTTTEGVKDVPEGAVVTGLGGKGDVVAVGLAKTRPWIAPLTDGPGWSLSGSPRVVHLRAGEAKTLRSEPRLPADPKERRIVVWRR